MHCLLPSVVTYASSASFCRLREVRVAKEAASWGEHQCAHNAATCSPLASNYLRWRRSRLGRRRVAGLPAPPEAGRTDDLPPGKRDGSITRHGALPLRDAAAAALGADGARPRSG